MWLEVPRGTSCLEDLYYQVVLSLFSLITSLVERGVGVPEERGGVAAAAGPMLQALSLVRERLGHMLSLTSDVHYQKVFHPVLD